jgi:hypothetical protein
MMGRNRPYMTISMTNDSAIIIAIGALGDAD